MEWVASGGGLYFTEGDTDDLARKIEQLGSDRSLRERLSQGVISRINSDEMNYNKQITVLHERMKVLVVGSKGQTSTLHPVVKKIRVNNFLIRTWEKFIFYKTQR
jgi:hypothetical protein